MKKMVALITVVIITSMIALGGCSQTQSIRNENDKNQTHKSNPRKNRLRS